jgi:hypothetical protein
LWLDLRILACTALRMSWIKGPTVTRLLGLERIVFLPSSKLQSDTAHTAPVSVASLAESANGDVVWLDRSPPAESRVELPAAESPGVATARVVA